uniref:Uncharacterized protein n=1 Tax=Romanomermis culicivorax TaxID=13658 RepID=A0A915HK61_ROMCU
MALQLVDRRRVETGRTGFSTRNRLHVEQLRSSIEGNSLIMALVENAVVPKARGDVIPAKELSTELFPLEAMDVPTSLAYQFTSKLRARNAAKSDIEVAEKMFKEIRFEDYEESSLARLMTFQKENSDEVIEKFCKSHKFSDDTAEGLKFAAALLDSDRSAETWIKFQKGEEGEFFVNFVAMRRIEFFKHSSVAVHDFN